MNAAARLLNQGILSRGWVISVFISRANVSLYVLIVGVLISALCTVYVTNSSRTLNSSIAQMMADRDRIHVQTGQLLLEKSTLIMQARIQNSAEQQLGMVEPNHQSVVVIKE